MTFASCTSSFRNCREIKCAISHELMHKILSIGYCLLLRADEVSKESWQLVTAMYVKGDGWVPCDRQSQGYDGIPTCSIGHGLSWTETACVRLNLLQVLSVHLHINLL